MQDEISSLTFEEFSRIQQNVAMRSSHPGRFSQHPYVNYYS